MRLLITGGCGFLGSNLASEALARGDELVVFDNLHRNGSRKNLTWLRDQGRFNFEHGDIRNQNDIDRAVKTFMPDAIFHLAGQVAMTTSIVNPRMDFEVNVIGTYNLLEVSTSLLSLNFILPMAAPKAQPISTCSTTHVSLG